MNIENEWLEQEMKGIYNDKKRKKVVPETFQMLKVLLMLTAVFFCSTSLDAKPIKYKINQMAVVDGGHRQFICPKCYTVQWQNKKNADWQGKFYCVSCKTNLGN